MDHRRIESRKSCRVEEARKMDEKMRLMAKALDQMADAQMVASRNEAEARSDSAAEVAVEAGVEQHASEYRRRREELLNAVDDEHASLLSRHAQAGPLEVDGALAILQEFQGYREEEERKLVVLDGIAALREERRR